MAPTLSGRAALSEMAAVEIGHYRLLADRLTDLGANPEKAMTPFVAALEGFHAMTAPSTWLEGWSRPTSATGWRRTSTER